MTEQVISRWQFLLALDRHRASVTVRVICLLGQGHRALRLASVQKLWFTDSMLIYKRERLSIVCRKGKGGLKLRRQISLCIQKRNPGDFSKSLKTSQNPGDGAQCLWWGLARSEHRRSGLELTLAPWSVFFSSLACWVYFTAWSWFHLMYHRLITLLFTF